ncbi:MAG: hypothetical protein IPI67_09310 [Myxococcales bacterium]|nr:hypothetical protein [Myxococcales bacterium]
MRKSLLFGGLGLSLGGAAAFAACKLDLDESLINPSDASIDGAGGAAGSGGGGTGGTSGSGGTSGTGGKGDGGPCDAAAQCTTDAACLEGLCAGGQCLFELCPSTSACEGRSCDTQSGTCGAAENFGFKAGSIELTGNIGCSGSASRCVAALADLVFVMTADGVLHGWRTTNPAKPEQLTVESPTFSVARMVAAEGRLLMLSAVSAGKLQLAWLDPPGDPKATSLSISSAGVNFAGATSAVYPSGPTSFLVVENSSASFYPGALIAPPVQNNATITGYPSTGLVPGAAVVAASGTRLVSYRVDGTSTPVVPTFTLIPNAGTTNAQNGAEQTVAFEAPSDLSANHFSTGFDGSVVWSTNRVFRTDAGNPETNAVTLRWLLAPGATSVDTSLEVDLASYSDSDWSTVRRGPVALVDGDTVLTTVAYPVDPQQTLVRSVKKSGSSLTLGSATAVLPFSVGQIGVAANRKVGFVLTPSSTSPTLAATLHVFAPACG